MTQMTERYLVRSVTIPPEKLRRIVEIPLGFQPLGITSQGNRVAIAAYFEPAICLAKVGRKKNLILKPGWIRGVLSGGASVRLFPADISRANRCQTVNFGSAGTLWISRNTGREFFTLIPHPAIKEQWVLAERISLPESDFMVHSALLTENRIFTVESPLSLKEWVLCRYELQTKGITLSTQSPLPAFMYGIAIKNDDLFFVTDFRSREKPGIYREKQLIVPNVFGNGICFLEDGSALVSRYGQGQGNPFNGVPGALIYIPASLLK